MSHEQEYLLFITKSGNEYKLTSRCYNYTHCDGFFNMRMGNAFVKLHRSMISFFYKKAQGKVPEIELVTSYSSNEKSVTNWLTIINLGDNEIEIFHTSNRQAFTFFVIDQYGNPLVLRGYAKVGQIGGVLTISAGEL